MIHDNYLSQIIPYVRACLKNALDHTKRRILYEFRTKSAVSAENEK